MFVLKNVNSPSSFIDLSISSNITAVLVLSTVTLILPLKLLKFAKHETEVEPVSQMNFLPV